MIWKTLEAVVSFYVLFKAIKSYKNLKQLYSLLKRSPIKNVRQMKQLLKNKKPLQKLFVVIKGIAQSNSKHGQKDIISIIQTTPLQTKQSTPTTFQKLNWRNIIDKYDRRRDWRRPRNLSNIQFGLKDIIQNQTIQVSNCSNSDISGGMSQIFSDVIIYEDSKSAIGRFMKSLYNFVIDFIPFRFFLNKIKVGDQLRYFGILEGQYLLSIGKVFKTADGKIKMENPMYLTKQKGFIQKRLKRKMKYLYWLILATGLLQFYFLYKLISQLISLYRKRKQQKKFHQQQQQRSQDEGQFVNCIICYTNIRTIALKPCRHYAFCQQCYQNIKDKTCPLCKSNIDGILKIVKRKK